jgi:hypothetical protein
MHWLKALKALSKTARLVRGRRWRWRPEPEIRRTVRCLPTGILRSARCSYPPALPLLRRRIA